MSIQEQLDPAAADEVVASGETLRDLPVVERALSVVSAPVVPAPGRIARGARATGRGLLTLTLFLVGIAAGFGAGWGYGPYLKEDAVGRTDLLPSYAAWPVLWWVLLASIPVALGLAFWKRIRPIAFGYVLALPWQLVLSLGYALYTFGTWGYSPTP